VTRGTEVVAGEVKPAQEIHSDACAIQHFLRYASPLSHGTHKPHISLTLSSFRSLLLHHFLGAI